MTAELRIPGVCHVCSFPVLSGGTLCRHCREAGEQDLPVEAPAQPAAPDPSPPLWLSSEDSPISPEWDAITPRGRSLASKIRNPSSSGLVAAFLLSVIPLTWPLFLYMALRYLTGHRHRVVDAETAAASRRRTLHLAARQASVLASLGTGALYAVWRIWPTFVPAIAPTVFRDALPGVGDQCVIYGVNGIAGEHYYRNGSVCVDPISPAYAGSPAYLDWTYAVAHWPLILLEAAALAALVFLAMAALHWAWQSFR
jgi:hypothetical protein